VFQRANGHCYGCLFPGSVESGEGIQFEDIPFSEIEARLLIETGTWRNFDDLEECLILDELLLLTEALNQKEKNTLKMHASLQGVDIGGDEGSDDLPEEILEMERAHKKKMEEQGNSGIPGVGFELVKGD
jgi:hypothetical protein